MKSKTPKFSNKSTVLLGLAILVKLPSGTMKLKPLWGRIFLLLVLLFNLIWVGKSVGFYYYFKYRRNFEIVKFSDMIIFPFNRAEHSKLTGDYYIEKSKKALKEGNGRAALSLAQKGLARSRGNIEGRMIYAKFFLFPEIGRIDKAIKVLEDGIRYGRNNEEYISFFCNVLLHYQKDHKLIALARELLPENPNINSINKTIAMSAAQAYYFRGKYDLALKLVNDYELYKNTNGVILTSKIEWEKGDRASSIKKVRDFINLNPREDRLYSYLGDLFRKSGDFKNAIKNAVTRSANNPLSPLPRIEIIYTYFHSGNKARALEEVESVIRQFNNDENAMKALANFAADTGNVKLTRRLYEIALEKDFGVSDFSLLFIESTLVSRNYQGAIDFAEELAQENPSWLKSSEEIHNSLLSVAYFGLGNVEFGELYLNRFLQSKKIEPQMMLAVAKRFNDINEKHKSQRILIKANEAEPDNQSVLSKLVEINLNLGNSQNMAENLRKLLNMRQTSKKILRRAYKEISSDRFVFEIERNNIRLELAEILKLNNPNS